MVLCCKMGFKIPGEVTIPERIAQDKQRYYKALDQADASWKAGYLDVSEMEELLKDLAAKSFVEALS